MIAATSAEYSQQSHDYQSWLQSIWVIAVMTTLFATTDTVSAVGEGVTITESGGSTDVTEGGATDTFTVVLDASPSFETVIVFVLSRIHRWTGMDGVKTAEGVRELQAR